MNRTRTADVFLETKF